MTEHATFSELVREAFIDPLRSVLIVDDEYPTWEEILNAHVATPEQDVDLQDRSLKKPWRGEPGGPLSVIREFRNRKPGFIIDIHDALAPSPAGSKLDDEPLETPKDLADHLHQSDLLVLDYNLEGDQTGLGGARARDILRLVLTNNRFNLIIVHTGEDDLEGVMSQCLISLMRSCTSQFEADQKAQIDEIDEKLSDLEFEEEFNRDQVHEIFNTDIYLETRQIGVTSSLRKFMGTKAPYVELSELAKKLGLEGGEKRKFFFWTIKEFERKRLGAFAQSVVPDGLEWSISDGPKWMRTTRGFVSFVNKGPGDLLAELQTSLEDWKPTPSRLLSAKFRHVLNSSGIEAEDRSLLKRHVFAQFYKSICSQASPDISSEQAGLLRAIKLKEHVSRQSESIAFLIEDEIVEFGEKIINADGIDGWNFSSHYGVDLDNENEQRTAVAQYNNYVSNLPLKEESDQLDSGHVFKLGNEWWVCATPACDLQPGQNSIAFKGKSEDLRPFTALKLVQVNPEDIEDEHINSGSYCFIEDDGKIICLGLRSLKEEIKPATQKVTWRTLVARKGGLISNRLFTVLQLELDSEEIKTPETEAIVVAKLRYEYALNYIQRVGSSVSRIGLDYSAF